MQPFPGTGKCHPDSACLFAIDKWLKDHTQEPIEIVTCQQVLCLFRTNDMDIRFTLVKG